MPNKIALVPGGAEVVAIGEHRMGNGTPLFNEDGSPLLNKAGKHIKKDDGTLICRHITIRAPLLPVEPRPKCSTWQCLKEYAKEYWAWQKICRERMKPYILLSQYHQLRMGYAELKVNRDSDIPMRYRTGDDAPETVEELINEVKILKKLLKGAK